MSTQNAKRFRKVNLLTEATPVLGASAGAWDRAIKGDLPSTMAEIRRRVTESRARGQTNATPAPSATTDVASSFRRRMLGAR